MVNSPHWPSRPIQPSIKYDLSRVNALLEALGNPHKRLPPIIHIAGTNGKGSTVAYLHAIFEEAGYLVHTYSSPHLVTFNERIIVAGQQITDEQLYDVCERTRLAAESCGCKPTFFEAITAAAFLAFSERAADILILETGIGGRLDATNIVDRPLMTIITPISFDHMQYLGTSLSSIAREKAGIIKTGVPCMVSSQEAEVLKVIRSYAVKARARVWALGQEVTIYSEEESFTITGDSYSLTLPKPNLLGSHQIVNAAIVAASCYQVLNKRYNIKFEHIQQGITAAKHPGRLQRISSSLVTSLIGNSLEVWLDGAHNTAGAKVLSEWARSKWPKVSLIIALSHQRHADIITEHFRDLAEHFYCVPIMAEVDSYPPEILASVLVEDGLAATACKSITEALQVINNNNPDAKVLVTGSLYLVGDFLQLINTISV